MLSLQNKILRKNDFVETVWPPNVFVYVPTHYVETIKKLDCRRYKKLTRWPIGNAPDIGSWGTGLDSCLWQGLFLFAYLFRCFCDFFVKTHIYMNLCNSFCNNNLFCILNILQNWWSTIMVYKRGVSSSSLNVI